MGAIRFGNSSNINLIAVDAQTERVFVLDGAGVAVLDANRV
jgi:hypothetical protein